MAGKYKGKTLWGTVSGLKVKETTEEEYNALSDAEKQRKDVLYIFKKAFQFMSSQIGYKNGKNVEQELDSLNSTLKTEDITSNLGCDFGVSWLVAKKKGNEVNISGGITPHITLGVNGVLLRNLPTIGAELRWTIGSTLDGTIYPLYVKGSELYTQKEIPLNTRVVFSITYIQ